MIIVCPKCKTQYNVDSSEVSGFEVFSCSECGYEWLPLAEAKAPEIPAAAATATAAAASAQPSHEAMDRGKLMRGLGLAGTARPKAKKSGGGFWRSFLWALAGVAIAAGCFVAIEHFTKPAKVAALPPAELYIEISQTPEYFREGMSEYIMVRGQVVNNSAAAREVPKIMVRLLNREGRIMQEQEREVEAANLAPGEAVYFSYKILRFSDKIEKVSVDFAGRGR